MKLVVKRKLGANGSLFGAVTKDEIAHDLKVQHGIDIDKKTIEIEHAIKTTGDFDVSSHKIRSWYSRCTENLSIIGE